MYKLSMLESWLHVEEARRLLRVIENKGLAN